MTTSIDTHIARQTPLVFCNPGLKIKCALLTNDNCFQYSLLDIDGASTVVTQYLWYKIKDDK